MAKVRNQFVTSTNLLCWDQKHRRKEKKMAYFEPFMKYRKPSFNRTAASTFDGIPGHFSDMWRPLVLCVVNLYSSKTQYLSPYKNSKHPEMVWCPRLSRQVTVQVVLSPQTGHAVGAWSAQRKHWYDLNWDTLFLVHRDAFTVTHAHAQALAKKKGHPTVDGESRTSAFLFLTETECLAIWPIKNGGGSCDDAPPERTNL